MAGERDRAGRVAHREVEREVLGLPRGVDAPFGAVAAPVGVPVLEDGATARLGSRTQSVTVIDGGAHQDASRSGVDPVPPDDIG